MKTISRLKLKETKVKISISDLLSIRVVKTLVKYFSNKI